MQITAVLVTYVAAIQLGAFDTFADALIYSAMIDVDARNVTGGALLSKSGQPVPHTCPYAIGELLAEANKKHREELQAHQLAMSMLQQEAAIAAANAINSAR